MEPSRHLKSKFKPTRGVCGAGYDWPSGILLTEDPNKVTCSSCQKLTQAKEA